MPKLIWKKVLISKDILKQYKLNIKNLKTHNRSLSINIFLLNKLIQVYNGINYFPLHINNSKLNYKLGYFIPTKKNYKNYNNLVEKKLILIKKNGTKSTSVNT